MLSIRFSRVGKKNNPLFRLIVVDKRKDPWGKAVEILGNRNPHTKALVMNTERVKYWLSMGAQPTASVHNLLVDQKLVEGKKQAVTNISKKRAAKLADKKGAAEAKAPASAEPAAPEAPAAETPAA